MGALRRLVLGTGNRKKGLELFELLSPLGLELVTLADCPTAISVVEDADSFEGNGRKKAVEQALHLAEWVLGEDSGLAVDALRGAPGVYSARYAGPDATDALNNERLLSELRDVPDERRGAHYVCHAVISDPDGQVRAESVGRCFGRIRREAAGSGGFGYDPLFEIVEYHQTFGELGPVFKSIISHRARALRQLLPEIARLMVADAAG
jgi:XTP/dITP diphosphohydrolase